jgi:hypothetical protein
MTAVSRASLWLACSGLLIAATACSAPTITAFAITAGPAITIAPGGSAILTVSATTTAGKPQTAGIVIFNLPQQVSYSPGSATVTTGGQTAITITASPIAVPSTTQAQVVGYAGLAGSTVYVPVTVVAAQ